MSPAQRHAPRLLFWLLFAAASMGCQAAGQLKAPIDNVAPQREQRKQEVVRDFEARRDDAQYKAAVDRWQQGDSSGALDALTTLLKRNPRHAGGLKLLAELEQVANAPDNALPGLLPGGNARALPPGGSAMAGFPFNRRQPGAGIAPDSGVVQAAHISTASDGRPAEFGSGIGLPEMENSTSDQTDVSHYTGGARGEVARRSIAQATAALAVGDAQRAATYYRAAAAAENDNARILVAAAVMSLRYEQPALALEMAQLAVANFADNADASRVLGAVYYRRGEYDASRIALQRAILLDKSHPLSYFLMGSTLAKLGQTEAADWYFQQAQRLDPKYSGER